MRENQGERSSQNLLADLNPYKRARSLHGRHTEPLTWFPRALAYSLVVHGVLVTGAIYVSDIDRTGEVGVSNPTPEIAMAPRTPRQSDSIFREREIELTTEVPPIMEFFVMVEKLPEREPLEPPLDETLDPLLEEEPFEDLELEPLPTPEVEAIPQEPVGEESEPVRRLLESPPAAYPQVAAMRHLEGTVVLRLIVDPSGRVVEVELVSTSGHGSLDRAAIAAANGYLFEAGEGALTVSKTFIFRLP